jgi:hypothetical protein
MRRQLGSPRHVVHARGKAGLAPSLVTLVVNCERLDRRDADDFESKIEGGRPHSIGQTIHAQ